MSDLGTAIGLLLVIEGVLYALFPGVMQRVMAQALALSPAHLRTGGLAAALLGFALVWLIRG